MTESNQAPTSNDAAGVVDSGNPSAAAPAPAYSFTPRVLERWARSNLQLTPRADGGHDAVFRFHGSTCGNIEFDLIYHATVGSAAEGHPLRTLHCEPAPHGDGHTRMCCWRENAEKVRDWMQRETPLLGQPLADALSWNPQKSASGCLCHVDGRRHKWNAVFQTLHFALAQNSPS